MKKILALMLALALALPLASCRKKDPDPTNTQPTPTPEPEIIGEDIFSLNFSEYLEISSDYYKGLTVEVKVNKVDSEDVESLIGAVLRENRTQCDGGDKPIAEGDVVHVFYKGYILDGENKKYFSGGSNIGDDSYALEIGSGAFVSGFESGMIGKIPADYSESEPMIVAVTFPEKYPSNPDLAGKDAYFEVSVEVKDEKYRYYKLPELTDEFITDTLGFTEEQLSVYVGDTTVEQYRAYVFDTLKWQGVDIREFAEDVYRPSVLKGVNVKKYPERQLQEYSDRIINRLKDYYDKKGLSSLYNTFDQFMCSQYELPYGSDWRGEVEKDAKLLLLYDMVSYHIMNLEGLKPSEDEYAKLLIDYLDSEIKKSGVSPEVFSTAAEYEAYREQYRAKMTLEYGKEYFRDKIYKMLVFDMVINCANIVEITE